MSLFQVSYTNELVDEFEPKWINHRWHYRGRKYRSLRQLKSSYWYKLECSLSKILAYEIQKEIDREVLRSVFGTDGCH